MRQRAVLHCLRAEKKTLEAYGVQSLSLFGSIARNEAETDSDIDLLVSFRQTPGLFEFIALKDYLESILKAKVDLVTEQALHQSLRTNILKDSIDAF